MNLADTEYGIIECTRIQNVLLHPSVIIHSYKETCEAHSTCIGREINLCSMNKLTHQEF